MIRDRSQERGLEGSSKVRKQNVFLVRQIGYF